MTPATARAAGSAMPVIASAANVHHANERRCRARRRAAGVRTMSASRGTKGSTATPTRGPFSYWPMRKVVAAVPTPHAASAQFSIRGSTARLARSGEGSSAPITCRPERWA